MTVCFAPDRRPGIEQGVNVVSLEPVDQYLRTFTWNKVKYRADKSLGELIDLLQKVCP